MRLVDFGATKVSPMMSRKFLLFDQLSVPGMLLLHHGLSFVLIPQGRAPLAPTSVASQSSHLNNASFYYLPASFFPFSFFL